MEEARLLEMLRCLKLDDEKLVCKKEVMMMKVLLIDQIARVNYKYTFPLANGLCKSGIEVHLVLDQKQEKENCTCERTLLFNTDEKNINKLKKLKNYVISYRKIGNILRNGNYDVLHTQWYTFSPVDYYFLKKFKLKYGVRYVATVHDILPFNQKLYDMYYHRKLYRLADSIILQAPGNMKRFTDLFPESKDKIHMIPLGHILDYVEICSKKLSREYLGLPMDKDIILFFGQIKKVKGVDVLLRALNKLKDKFPNIYIVIAGSVWKMDFDECQEIIDNGKLDTVVRTDMKYVPDEEVKYYYSACDACVLPYTDVYQSGVIQLAYGYKKPVVATSLPAFTQFVKEGKTGFVAEPGDIMSLANAISRALSNKQQFESIGENGYELVRKNLDWNVLADRIAKECYEC